MKGKIDTAPQEKQNYLHQMSSQMYARITNFIYNTVTAIYVILNFMDPDIFLMLKKSLLSHVNFVMHKPNWSYLYREEYKMKRISFLALNTCNIEKTFFKAFVEVRAAVLFTTAMKNGATISLQTVLRWLPYPL